MVEIYSYDIATHEQFARAQQEIEAFRRQYHIAPSEAKGVAVQTKVLDFVPKHGAVVLLMQSYQRKLWARFMLPPGYYTQRATSPYIAPSLGSREKQDADIKRLQLYVRKRAAKPFGREEEEQGETDEAAILVELLEKGVKETNEMIDFVISRMHQFIQA
ncbi:MAG: DUF5399 family protein [Chlamydiales bacterium]